MSKVHTECSVKDQMPIDNETIPTEPDNDNYTSEFCGEIKIEEMKSDDASSKTMKRTDQSEQAIPLANMKMLNEILQDKVGGVNKSKPGESKPTGSPKRPEMMISPPPVKPVYSYYHSHFGYKSLASTPLGMHNETTGGLLYSRKAIKTRLELTTNNEYKCESSICASVKHSEQQTPSSIKNMNGVEVGIANRFRNSFNNKLTTQKSLKFMEISNNISKIDAQDDKTHKSRFSYRNSPNKTRQKKSISVKELQMSAEDEEKGKQNNLPNKSRESSLAKNTRISPQKPSGNRRASKQLTNVVVGRETDAPMNQGATKPKEGQKKSHKKVLSVQILNSHTGLLHGVKIPFQVGGQSVVNQSPETSKKNSPKKKDEKVISYPSQKLQTNGDEGSIASERRKTYPAKNSLKNNFNQMPSKEDKISVGTAGKGDGSRSVSPDGKNSFRYGIPSPSNSKQANSKILADKFSKVGSVLSSAQIKGLRFGPARPPEVSSSQLLRKAHSGLVPDSNPTYSSESPPLPAKNPGAAPVPRASKEGLSAFGLQSGIPEAPSYGNTHQGAASNPRKLPLAERASVHTVGQTSATRPSKDKERQNTDRKTVRKPMSQNARLSFGPQNRLAKDAGQEIKIQLYDNGRQQQIFGRHTAVTSKERTTGGSSAGLATKKVTASETVSKVNSDASLKNKHHEEEHSSTQAGHVDSRHEVETIAPGRFNAEERESSVVEKGQELTRRAQIDPDSKSDPGVATKSLALKKQELVYHISECIVRKELPVFHYRYTNMRRIGKGSFGMVYSAVSVLTGETVAVKLFDREHLTKSDAFEKVDREFKIQWRLEHVNTTQMLELYKDEKYIYFVMEYADKGDLLSKIVKGGVLSEQQAREIVCQVILGIEACHTYQVLHRDIKLDNILLNSDNVVKICDFGVSVVMREGKVMKDPSGTPAYIAPELIRGEGYSGFKADVWSLGITLYTMLTGTIPFQSVKVDELHGLILKGKFGFPERPELSPEVKDLIRRILVLEPSERLSLEEVKQHSWFPKGSFDTPRRQADTFLNYPSLREHLVSEVESYGFPREYIVDSVRNRVPNHIFACYSMLKFKEDRSIRMKHN